MAKKKIVRRPDPSNVVRETTPEQDAARAVDPNVVDPKTPFEALLRLNKDLRQAARLMGSQEARFLIDLYYQIQQQRMRLDSQILASSETEPFSLMGWLSTNQHRFESDIKRALFEFSDEYKIGRWLMSIKGIAEVLSANILAMFDIRRAPTVGHWWRFAGLDPSRVWHGAAKAQAFLNEVGLTTRSTSISSQQINRLAELSSYTAREIETAWHGGVAGAVRAEAVRNLFARRPYSVRAKTLVTFKIGECLNRVKDDSSTGKDYYGRLYDERKEYENRMNDEGRYAEFAALQLKIKKYENNDARRSYEAGRLPKAHIHARCRRWVAKLFISHVHHAMYVDYYGKEPPVPFAFTKCPGDHRHFIPLPNFPFEGEGRGLKELYERDDAYLKLVADAAAEKEAKKKLKEAAKEAKKKAGESAAATEPSSEELIQDLEADLED